MVSHQEGKGVLSSSLNAICCLTSPKSGHISAWEGKENLKRFRDSVEDETFDLFVKAWRSVAVPSEWYWSYASHTTPSTVKNTVLPSIATPPRPVLTPQPFNISGSFYSSRVDATTSRGYSTGVNQVVIGIDRTVANGSKLFNIFNRGNEVEVSLQPVAGFTGSLNNDFNRNMYVLVDESAAVDPFLDIDFSYSSSNAHTKDCLIFDHLSTDGVLDAVKVEALLSSTLKYMESKLEKEFSASIEECLLLTSSLNIVEERENLADVTTDVKLSFHVHFRLANGLAFANVRQLHLFMTKLRVQLEQEQKEDVTLQCIHSLIDFGVYTRWRAFRLPYNVKCPFGVDFSHADATAMDVLESEWQDEGLAVPGHAIGDTATQLVNTLPLQRENQRKKRLFKKLSYKYRFLLPVIPGLTIIKDGGLKAFLEAHPVSASGVDTTEGKCTDLFVNKFFELAFIQRESSTVRSTLTLEEEKGRKQDEAENDPFKVPLPAFPRSQRIPIVDVRVKKLLCEVFACIAPQYATGHRAFHNMNEVTPGASPITPEGLFVQYEEGIRSYYVIQKQNRFCMRQNRYHKSTYTQLFLTYGSIKMRCYSNDCCDRCFHISWEEGNETHLEAAEFFGWVPQVFSLGCYSPPTVSPAATR